MPGHIKRAALAGQQEEADAKIRTTVETIIADVARRGDAAVREFSERFDKWSPPSFRLSEDEIAALVAKVASQTIDDIKFAQAQIRNFAEIVSGCGPPWFGGVQAVMWPTPATRAVTIDICAEATIG